MIFTAHATLVFGSAAEAQPRATLIAEGFDRPIAFVQDPSDPAVQVVVEQSGRVRVLRNGALQPNDFLDLSSVVLAGGEQGLLGFAFSPDYGSSGRVFASFINLGGHSVLARFTRSNDDPTRVDPDSRFDFRWPDGLPFILQPFPNHNGGNIAFGSDGYLYFGLGDGGDGGDPLNNAQSPGTLLGKMLRLDVSVGDTDPEGYDVPPDNPFLANAGVLGEIWAFGLRNPWRWSFDDLALGGTGALIVGDVGQVGWEEIDYEPAGAGGRNYGWRIREGAHPYIDSLPPFSSPLIDPIHNYDRTTGACVIGGVVYRGSLIPNMYGRYFFADFSFQRVWSAGLSLDPTGEATVTGIQDHSATLGITPQNWSSFGVDASGEIYLLSYYAGRVYRLDPSSTGGTELVWNGGFDQQSANWVTYATPDSSHIVSQVSGGVFEFYRVAPAGNEPNEAFVSQWMNQSVAPLARLRAAFDLGNSDSVRKRIKVLVHDANFSDLAACSFFLAPHAPLRTYEMQFHATQAWANATISFYAATTGSAGGFYRIDNVSVQQTNSGPLDETRCIDPTVPEAPGGPPGPELVSNGDFAGSVAPWQLYGQVVGQITNGVFQLYRSGIDPPGVVLQSTGQPIAANEIVTATFRLGNSTSARRRVKVLLHDLDFSDIAACSFWLPAGQAMADYTMRTFTTKAWANATVSIYPTGAADPWTQLDDVSLKRTPGVPTSGTNCIE